MTRISLAIVPGLLAAIIACGGASGESSGFSGKTASFGQDVRPVLQEHCVSCHGQKGDLSLESYEALMRGRDGNPVLVPGNPDRSDIVEAVETSRMPKLLGFHKPLSEAEMGIIRLWIAQGAKNN